MSGAQEPDVPLQVAGGVATITLSAPWRGNALDRAMLARLEQHLLGLSEDVRLVVLRGAGGRSFSTGYHLPTLLAELDQGPSVTDFEEHPLERALRALEQVAVPTLAVIQGNAYGAGCELALACDLRLASADSRLCMPPARLGILYSATGLQRLLALVGPAFAQEMLFTAEPVDAERALAIGLVNRLVPAPQLEQALAALTATIAANSALSLRHTKTIFRRYLSPPGLTAQAQREVAALREECFRSPDFTARVRALLGDR